MPRVQLNELLNAASAFLDRSKRFGKFEDIVGALRATLSVDSAGQTFEWEHFEQDLLLGEVVQFNWPEVPIDELHEYSIIGADLAEGSSNTWVLSLRSPGTGRNFPVARILANDPRLVFNMLGTPFLATAQNFQTKPGTLIVPPTFSMRLELLGTVASVGPITSSVTWIRRNVFPPFNVAEVNETTSIVS